MRDERRIRIEVLQLLCQFDAGNNDAVKITPLSFDEETSDTSDPSGEAVELANQIWAERENTDAVISALTPEWPIHRQPIIDRNILRIAKFEIQSASTPSKVAIDEAIELAKEFSTEQSPTFINGVLDAILNAVPSDAGSA
ncbi:MAG: transcription antitermination factor NusB [Phycisphaerales bacterium]|nr:transcription antitermination factor NusB [Phycisphaerales bacterium]